MNSSNVNEIMTSNPVDIGWDEPMEEARQKMETLKIRHLPVTDFSGAVIGILSDRDVKRAMNPDYPGFSAGSLVRDYMAWPVITMKESRPLKDAAEAMIEEKISAILVTGNGGNVTGIVTSEDLLRVLAKMLDQPHNSVSKITYSPVLGEFLREAQAAGL